MKKILVTGANGLIGADLISSLLESSGYEVYGLSRTPPSFNNKNYHAIAADLNGLTLTDQLPKHIDICVHLAQSEYFRDFPKRSREIFNVNTNSTLRLLDYAKNCGCQKFMFASSGGVYGLGKAAFSEELEINMRHDLGFYLGTKLMSELLVRNYASQMETITIRPFFVYGSRQRRSMLIPRLVDNVLNEIPITIKGDHGLHINPIHVSDASAAIKFLLEKDVNGIFNVAGSQTVSMRQLAKLIEGLVGKPPVLEFSDGEDVSMVGDIDRLKSIGFEPKVSIGQGLEEMVVNR